jgi:hypothetical protein
VVDENFQEISRSLGGPSDDRTDLSIRRMAGRVVLQKDLSVRYRYLLLSKNRIFGYPVFWVARSKRPLRGASESVGLALLKDSCMY